MNGNDVNLSDKEVKVCKHCGSEIPKQAKVCPYCNKKQSHKVRNTILIIFGVLLVIGIIGSMFGGGGSNTTTTSTSTGNTATDNNQQQQQEQQQQAQAPSVLTVGQQATVNGITVGLTGASLGSALNLNGLSQPAASGKEFLVCSFAVHNGSESDAVVSTASFEGYCDNQTCQVSGYTYMSDNGFTADFSLAPGRETSGVIVYEVPQGWQLMEIEFKPNMFLGDSLNFEIRPDQCQRPE